MYKVNSTNTKTPRKILLAAAAITGVILTGTIVAIMLPASTPAHAGSANGGGGGGGGTVSGNGNANGGSGGFAVGIGANGGRGGDAVCFFGACNN